MRRKQRQILVAITAALVLLIGVSAVASAKTGRAQVWVDGELFRTVVTSATFKPSSGNFDELYHGIVTDDSNTFGNGFGDGVPLISESKPGDQDYNGGRWHLNVLKSTVDPDKYANASSVEDLDPDDFVSTDVYFECPLNPMRGHGNS